MAFTGPPQIGDTLPLTPDDVLILFSRCTQQSQRPGPPAPPPSKGRAAFVTRKLIVDNHLLHRCNNALSRPASINGGSDQFSNCITNCFFAFSLGGCITAWGSDNHLGAFDFILGAPPAECLGAKLTASVRTEASKS